MTIPLMILAFLSIFGGWFAAPKLVGGIEYFEKFLQPVFSPTASAVAAQAGSRRRQLPAEGGVHQPGDGSVARAHGLARDRRHPRTARGLVVLHQEARTCRSAWRRAFTACTRFCSNKYYVDEIYAALIVRPLLWISTNVLWHVVDEGLIDGTVNGTATRRARIGQPGSQTAVGQYAQLRRVGDYRRRRLHRASVRHSGMVAH